MMEPSQRDRPNSERRTSPSLASNKYRGVKEINQSRERESQNNGDNTELSVNIAKF